MINLNPRRKVVTINVTKENIDKGCAGCGENCPIALAINPLINPEFEIYVGSKKVTFCESRPLEAAYLKLKSFSIMPRKARNFVVDYNNGALTSPFSFELAIPKVFLK